MHTGHLSKTVFKLITLPYYSTYEGTDNKLLLTHGYVPLLQISVADTTTTQFSIQMIQMFPFSETLL
jgi:hypothetical protein